MSKFGILWAAPTDLAAFGYDTFQAVVDLNSYLECIRSESQTDDLSDLVDYRDSVVFLYCDYIIAEE